MRQQHRGQNATAAQGTECDSGTGDRMRQRHRGQDATAVRLGIGCDSGKLLRRESIAPTLREKRTRSGRSKHMKQEEQTVLIVDSSYGFLTYLEGTRPKGNN